MLHRISLDQQKSTLVQPRTDLPKFGQSTYPDRSPHVRRSVAEVKGVHIFSGVSLVKFVSAEPIWSVISSRIRADVAARQRARVNMGVRGLHGSLELRVREESPAAAHARTSVLRASDRPVLYCFFLSSFSNEASVSNLRQVETKQ